jgi:undecaprenyl-diphosphatase
MLSQRRPKAAPLYYGLAAIVATSRVHVKVHHASDVVAGAVIGIAYAEVVRRLWPVPPR